ncbi:MDR family MFS transporter [Actinoplanes sp. NPDC026670]|uniref:MDR family MFS transporter n=1 Tax=Actinoplanes sp. NPDC026670 TaxID=3154700 RepID=UPI0033E02B0C
MSGILKALTGLLLALFISTLASTVVSTALPRMLADLDGTATQYTWVVTATLLAATAATPIWGKLADLFSKKNLIQIATVVFIAGSVASGLAQNAEQLIAARAVQGAGVGGLQALVQIAIAAMIPPRERGRYAGYLSSVTSVSTIGGPLLGGFIVDTSWLGWRWCFFIGVPFALLALVMLQLTLRLPVTRRDDVKIDYWGAALITGGVSLLLIWVSFVGDAFAWGSWQTAAMVSGTLVLLGLAVVVEQRVPEPVVPPRILRSRTTALAILGSLAAGTAMYGAAVFLSQYFQVTRGHTPTEAGLLTIPMMAGILVSSLVAGRMISRSGRLKPYLITGATSLTAGFAILGLLDAGTPLPLIGAAMILIGAGVGMTMQNFVLVVQNTVALTDIGAASATVAFFRSLGGTIGVAVLGAILARQVATGTSYGDATGHIFAVSAGVAVLGILAAALLPPITLRTSLDKPATAGTASRR